MTRIELLQHLVTQARESGFEFRKWFRFHAARPWTTPAEAVEWLAQGDRAHILLFSHSFARAFFREGERIRFIQPALAYQRVSSNGTVKSVQRRAHTRQSNRQDVWQYHLREMAAADQPLRYIRRYLLLEEFMHEAQNGIHGEQTGPDGSDPDGFLGKSGNGHTPPKNTGDTPANYDDELLVRE